MRSVRPPPAPVAVPAGTRSPLEIRNNWLSAAVLVAAVLGLYGSWWREHERALDTLANQLVATTSRHAERLTDAIAALHVDVRMLAEVPPIQGIIRVQQSLGDWDPHDGSSRDLWISRLQQIYGTYLRSHPTVLQVRYIGVADGGRELVRVERRGASIETVATDALQRKGDRDYFLITRELPATKVATSPLNLNREHGQLALPLQPVVRVSTPIYDDSGEVFGIVVLNVDPGLWLKSLTTTNAGTQLYALSTSGDFIVHPDVNRTFASERGTEHTFASEFGAPLGAPRNDLLYYQHGDQTLYLYRHRFFLGVSPTHTEIELLATVSSDAVVALVWEGFSEDAGFIFVALVLFTAYRRNVRDRVALQESRRRLANIVDHSLDAIISVDASGVVVDWNRAAEQIIGETQQDAHGHSIHRWLPTLALGLQNDSGSGSSGSAESMAPVLSQQELNCHRQDGSSLKVAVTVSPIQGFEEVLAGWAIFVRDLSETALQRSQLLVANDILEREVQERTQHLQEARLEAEEAAMAKSQFLANMTHEIRTPMNAILGTLQLLQRTSLENLQQRYTDTAETAAKALLRTINDILDYSKIDSGKLELYVDSIALHDLMQEVGAVLSATVGSKPVDIVYDIEPNLPLHIRGDGLRLQQVLLNLAGNAIKFTERGHVVLSVWTEQKDAEHLSLEFSVADSGIGMTPEQISRVFEGFQQADNSTARRFGGTGLGLIISRHLVHLMGGEIAVQSQPGRGTTFRFKIHCPVHSTEFSNAEGRLDTLHGLRILCLDRKGVVRGAIKRTLEGFGWNVHTVDTVRLATAMCDPAATCTYDAVLFNALMEDPELTPWLTSFCRGPSLHKLVALTSSYAQHELFERYPQLSQHQVILTPATPSQLFEGVAGALDTNRPRRGVSRPEHVARLPGCRVLLVDDNEMNRDIAEELLRKEGASVTVAVDGREALQILGHLRSHNRFDVVLMDLHMPEINGYTATERIRKSQNLQQLPIIAMTANATYEDRRACLVHGMNDHVGKPFFIDELVSVIRRHVPAKPETNDLVPVQSQSVRRRQLSEASSPPISEEQRVQALARLGGSESLWHSSALKFVDKYRCATADWVRQLNELEDPQIREALIRSFHSLKGNAASLGAAELSEQAGRMERAVCAAASRDELDALFAELAACLGELVGYLEERSEQGNSERPREIDPLPLAKLDELLAALQRNSLSALDLWTDLKALLHSQDPSLSASLQHAVEAMDFPTALEICTNIREKLCA